MKRVLVLDANQRSALAVTRSLGHRGVEVLTADDTPRSLSSCSRFATRHFTCPSPAQHHDDFIATLAGLVQEQDIGMILPMTELTTMLILENPDPFAGVIIPFPPIASVDAISDKCRLMRLAEAENIPIPLTLYVENPDNLPCSLEELSYPLVIKPGRSWVQSGGQWRRAGVSIAGNADTAARILENDPALRTNAFMLQEYIAGKGQGIFTLYDRGRPLTFFAHRRLREKPPWGGVSVLSESIGVDPALVKHARAILESVNWHGVAMVEYKVTPQGNPYLMEINTRFWGSLQLAIDAGVDFPWLLYRLACNEHPEPVTAYRTGIRLRWLLGDLDSLYLTLRDSSNPTGERLSALLRFLAPSLKNTRYETVRWMDSGPFWCELRQYIADLWR